MPGKQPKMGALEAALNSQPNGMATASNWRVAWRKFVKQLGDAKSNWIGCDGLDLSVTLDAYASQQLKHSKENVLSPLNLMQRLNPLMLSEHIAEGLELLSACRQRRQRPSHSRYSYSPLDLNMRLRKVARVPLYA